jgi:tetratricopeptide (TPR) repeat protein
MSNRTADNLFMFSSLAKGYAVGFYQELLKGIGSHQQLGNRLIHLAEQAHAFRRFDEVQEIGQLLSNIPIKDYQAIGYYFLAVAANSKGNGDQEQARKLYERAAEMAPSRYRAKALLSLAAVSANTHNRDLEMYYYLETIKAGKMNVAALEAFRGIAIYKAIEGYHDKAVKDLESILPIIKHAPAHTYFDVLNSYAVELGAVGRIDEASNVSRIVLASPFAPAYPEWQETHTELTLKQKNHSSVTVPRLPEQQPKPKQIKPKDNVIKFPTAKKPPMPDEDDFSIALAPLQALGLILTAVLGDRITEDEVEKICNNYYRVIMDWYS